jgi:hypothetical protein
MSKTTSSADKETNLESDLQRRRPVESVVVGIDARDECLTLPDRARAKRRFAQGDFWGYLELFEPGARFAAYWEISLSLPTAVRFRLLADILCGDPAPHTNLRAWRRELAQCSRHPTALMTSEERRWRDELPKLVTVYRGAGPEEPIPKGIAWTLDHAYADVVAHLACEGSSNSGRVFEGVCNLRDVAGYLITEDGREDLVVLPEKLKHWRRIPMRRVVSEEWPDGRTSMRIIDEGSGAVKLPYDFANWQKEWAALATGDTEERKVIVWCGEKNPYATRQ